MTLEIKNDRTVLNDDAIREVTLPDMLDARDRRVWRQQELRSRYPGLTMVCFTMNIAGPVKNSPLIRRGFLYGCSQIRQQLMRIRRRAEYEILFDEFTGNEGYFMIALPPLEVKHMTVEVEDGDPIGRLFDMDVLDPDGRKLDRTELNADGSPDSGSHSVSAAGRIRPRTCLLCGRPAKECARSRTHTVGQLQEKTIQVLTGFFRERDLKTIARDACRALLYEVCTTPKPGLVDRVNTGSHQDMDIFTFMDSAAALQPYFRRCGEIGMDTRDASPEETFRQIRQAGIAAERDMLEATHGVNTHKGAVFSVGIACAALGRLDHALWKDPASVLAECGRIAAGIASKDFAKLAASINAAETADSAASEVPAPAGTPLTVGEKLYLRYGIRGVRGQAEDGFPAVLHAGLPVLEKELAAGADINRAGSVAMLAILCADTDTNLIARGGRELQLEVTEQVRSLLEKTPSPEEKVIADLDRQFIEKNLSPGGSADLLGLCFLLHFLKSET